jgi:hypothetical protein
MNPGPREFICTLGKGWYYFGVTPPREFGIQALLRFRIDHASYRPLSTAITANAGRRVLVVLLRSGTPKSIEFRLNCP